MARALTLGDVVAAHEYLESNTQFGKSSSPGPADYGLTQPTGSPTPGGAATTRGGRPRIRVVITAADSP